LHTAAQRHNTDAHCRYFAAHRRTTRFIGVQCRSLLNIAAQYSTPTLTADHRPDVPFSAYTFQRSPLQPHRRSPQFHHSPTPTHQAHRRRAEAAVKHHRSQQINTAHCCCITAYYVLDCSP
jgi:hypothetical protein